MDLFDRLAEAKIRDWQDRGRPHGASDAPALGVEGSLESQLLGEIVTLRAQALVCHDPEEQSVLTRRARELKLQLMVLLESSGRPLAAQQVERNLDAADAAARRREPR